jgi:outer membrane autotransporter protein
LYIYDRADLIINAGHSVTSSYGKLVLEGGASGIPSFLTFQNGASLTLQNTAQGIVIGAEDQTGTGYAYGTRGTATVNIDQNATATIEASKYFQILRSGLLQVKAGANLTLNVTTPWGGSSNEGLQSRGGLFIVGSYYGIGGLNDENGNSLTNSWREPITNGGKVTLLNNSSLTINAAETYFGAGSSLQMDNGSSLTVTGRLLLEDGTYNFQTLTADNTFTHDTEIFFKNTTNITNTSYFWNDTTVHIQAPYMTNIIESDLSTIYFEENTNAGLEIILWTTDARISANKTVTAGVNIEFYSDSKNVEVAFLGGSILEATASNSRLMVQGNNGYESDIDVDTAGQAPAQIKVEQIISLFKNSCISVLEDSTLIITLNSTASNPLDRGVFTMGVIDTDFSSISNFTFDAMHQGRDNQLGGYIDMHTDNSDLIINGKAYFGEGGGIYLGKNTLTINGDAWFKDGFNLLVDRDDTTMGKIVINGQTNIEDGATILFRQLDSTDINASNKVVLTSSGGFTNSNVFTSSIFTFVQSGNDIMIDDFLGIEGVVDEVLFANGITITSNYERGTTVISNVITGDVPASTDLSSRLLDNIQVIAQLTKDDAPAALVALKQLLGEEALPYIEAHHETILEQHRAVVRRRDYILNSSNFSPSAGYKDALNRIWVSGIGSWVKQRNTSALYGYRYESIGVIIGYDREIDAVPGLTLGITGAISAGKLKNNDGLASTDVSTTSLGLYGLYQHGSGFFLYGNLGFGWAKYEATIDVPSINATKTSDFNSTSFNAGFGLGYTFNIASNVNFSASTGLDYIHIRQEGWKERIKTDPDNMAVANWFGDMVSDYVDIDVTFKLESVHEIGSVVLRPEIHAGVVFTPTSKADDLRVGFVGSNASFNLNGLETGRTRFRGGAGLKVQLTDYVDIGFSYEIEAKKGYTAHYGQLGIGISF